MFYTKNYKRHKVLEYADGPEATAVDDYFSSSTDNILLVLQSAYGHRETDW